MPVARGPRLTITGRRKIPVRPLSGRGPWNFARHGIAGSAAILAAVPVGLERLHTLQADEQRANRHCLHLPERIFVVLLLGLLAGAAKSRIAHESSGGHLPSGSLATLARGP